eukprot:m.1143151 g.1143151  ORF g.1143151 m.1143151 type:complete len:178 (+) comp24457_c0_seq12:208-741(+)
MDASSLKDFHKEGHCMCSYFIPQCVHATPVLAVCLLRYEPRKPILKNLSFSVLPGQTCAIVGSTGSGKSTIMRLLFRFYDVDAGSVTVNGENVATCTLESLRGIMGVVPQVLVSVVHRESHTTCHNTLGYYYDTQTEDTIETPPARETTDAVLPLGLGCFLRNTASSCMIDIFSAPL